VLQKSGKYSVRNKIMSCYSRCGTVWSII
jgi:hypothetical protein